MIPHSWKMGLIAIALTAGGSGGVVTWQAVSAREAALADLAALRAHRLKLQARAAAPLADLSVSIAEPRSSAPAPIPPLPAAPVPDPAPRPRAGEFSAQLMAKADDPVHQNHDMMLHRQDRLWDYRAVFIESKFTPEQIERFLDIDSAIYGRLLDVQTVMRAKGLASDDGAVKTLAADIETDFKRSVQREFGEEVWAKFDQHRQTSWPRDVAAGFAGIAGLANMPLDAQQGAQLTAAIIDATTRAPDGSIQEPCRVDWEKVDARAKLFLTPSQWHLFRTVESPGVGGGGARFVTQLNDAFLSARRKEESGPEPRR